MQRQVRKCAERADRQCIHLFARFLQSTGRSAWGVTRYPEDYQQGGIDAVAPPYAIQHTSVDALPNGRARDDWFGQVIEGLEQHFRGQLAFTLKITLRWGAVDKGLGQYWLAMNSALKAWIERNAEKLPDGQHSDVRVSGIPFAIDVTKFSSGRPGGVFFARYDPGDDTLAMRLRPQLAKRMAALPPYRAEGKRTLLLLESDNFALMSNVIMVEAFEAAFPVWPEELDELWFVHRVAAPTVNVHDLGRGHSWRYDPTLDKVLGHFDDHCDVRSSPHCGEA